MSISMEARRLSGYHIGESVRILCNEPGCKDGDCIESGVIEEIEHVTECTVIGVRNNEGKTSVIITPDYRVTVTSMPTP